MSLRYQINLYICIISVCILLIGSTLAIWQARQSINNEVDSSITLALQLIQMNLSNQPTHEIDWIYRLNRLEQTRHLKIQLKQASGLIINMSDPSLNKLETPPQWFVHLVDSDYPKKEYQLNTLNNQWLTLIIQANPMDEITEVWHETIALFSLLLTLIILVFLSINFAFSDSLHTIQTIIKHLKHIEKGHYDDKLPCFKITEYDKIAKAINQMNRVLEQTQQKNQTLTQHSLKIQEEERQHLSQELHDEFGQSLTAIKVMAVTATHHNVDIKKVTGSIMEICDHLVTVVRSMMKQLHPLILTELGLHATLEDLVHHWKIKMPQTVFQLIINDEVDMLDKTIIIQVFRVIQESLTNIIRHANATEVQINLSTTRTQLTLFINDNGQGCQLNNRTTGFGLQGIEERIKLLGGDLHLQSQPNQGFQIIAYIPINTYQCLK